ncbi:reverse transcriptase domain-containing protein [Bradyrhizobium roseum]|uniref:reverse transcriptase domain-containing protein n=1 Tax=Bradyrhizobium roseum TaxID=3056648 RepID=UPI002611C867|nr:reverse transcriptase domain-containing protein [Bradyrhizobium roseus]WKA28361.1 reverse transcriptase domain-containing protein [Bradyrhizobium roseus]
MQLLIKREIEREAKKRLAGYSRAQYYVHKYRISFQKRTGKKAKASAQTTPKKWSFHKHFDPRYCLNHSEFLASGIWDSLQQGAYEPTAASRTAIPKPSGGFRYIDSFSIPDAVVAKIFLNNLRSRNARIFSDSSYAYQKNKTPLDAIIHLRSLLDAQTIFISQYDFSKYFDSVDHSYLKNLIKKSGPFLTTHMERAVLKSVLVHEYIEGKKAPKQRTKGFPQGNSLSLFLANAAAHPLDTELGRLNGAFARFADDSVVVNYSYEDALQCASAFQRFSQSSGVEINQEKSTGIQAFANEKAGLSHIAHFDFLSYSFQRDGLHVSQRAAAAIKRRCARIIYNHLLLHPRRTKSFGHARLGAGFRDWDLVTCLNELRAYIYGGRSQRAIDDYLVGASNISNLSGAVSYFCLVEDSKIFRELDGWLIDCLYRAYNARTALLHSFPSTLASKVKLKFLKEIIKPKMIDGSWYDFPTIPMETRAPSFFTAWRAARKSWMRHGLGGIDAGGMGYSY